MTLTLYGSINTRASRCLWALEECGVAFDWRPLSTKDGSTRTPVYLAINPSGKLPALTDGDVVLSEALAINLYVAQAHGAGRLWPATAAARAKCLQWTLWIATEVEPHIFPLFQNLVLREGDARDQAAIDTHSAALRPRLALLDAALADRDYLLGAFSIADLNVGATIGLLRNAIGFDLAAYPALDAWAVRCYARPARVTIDAIPR